MRPPTTKGTLVTLHDGRVVQAVPASRNPSGTPQCKGCVAQTGEERSLCPALRGQCGAITTITDPDNQFIFIDNTPEAFAKYVLQLLGESE